MEKKAGAPTYAEREEHKKLYAKILQIYNQAVTPEGEHKFSLRKLCFMHKASYVGFLKWKEKTENSLPVGPNSPFLALREKHEPIPSDPVIIIRISELEKLLVRLTKDTLHTAIKELERDKKIKILD